ncbi:MAG: UPF0182 family protein [Synergistaceae bacterium]
MDINKLLDSIMKNGNAEWSEGNGTNDTWENENTNQSSQVPKMPKIPKIWIVLLGLFFLTTILLPWFAKFMTDLFWFQEYGFESVFWKKFIAQWELFFISIVPAFLVYYFNWSFAFKKSKSINAFYANEQAVPLNGKIIVGVALFMAFMNALGVMGEWDTLLKFFNATEFGESDPLFGKDISFYIFSLPFYNYLKTWLQGLLTTSLFISAILYFVMRAMSFNGRSFTVDKSIRIHLATLATLILSLWGLGYLLDRYTLLFSPTGVVFGAGYTDVHVSLPAMSVLAVASFLAALLLLLNVFKSMWRVSGIAIGSLFVIGIFASSFVPGLIQQYRVKPNEYEMEKPYLNYHLDYTRRAFGLNDVQTVAIKPENEVTAEEAETDKETINNVRLWDYAPLLRTYKQLQAIRTYYDFNDVYIDRYELDKENRQVMLAVRELDLTNLQNPTWVNTHLEFTHGYGVVMNPVNEVASGGLPNFFMKDLPTRQTIDIKLERPEIYFGTMKYSYVLVDTDVKEFDYPMGDSNVRGYYMGDGGVKIGSLWRRLLFALRFKDTEILFTGALKPESKVMYYRNVRQALTKIAPFLIFDDDTYPVIYKGKIIWVQDAYTWSQRYPYSKPFITADNGLAHFNGVNYLRNSVKATVDAYNGKMKFYVVDEKDPIIKTWVKIFPDMFKKSSEMSEDLWKHMRYPEDLFSVQADVYRTYHMNDTNTYYNREDVWEISANGKKSIAPNYVTMKLWGEKRAEFAIILPYMPLGRDNLIGWMAGRCDPENYGELLVYKFPKQKLVYGPNQVEALINQNPEISAQLSLWSQRGSDVLRGDLLVVPVGKSLLYVQPLYLKAETGELPELKRIITSTGGRVAWGETFAESLKNLIGGNISAKTSKTEKIDESNKNDKKDSSSKLPLLEQNKLVKEAQKLYDSAIKAQRSGDWARYGEEIKKLGNILSQMEE